jgi:hypothetical protein
MVNHRDAGPVSPVVATRKRAAPYVPPKRCRTTLGSSSAVQTKEGEPSSAMVKVNSSTG